MAETLADVIAKMTPKITALLSKHKEALGPGKEFVVKISVKSVPTSRVILRDNVAWKLTEKDWKLIFSKRWLGQHQMVLEAVRENGNRPTSVTELKKTIPNLYAGDRDRINRAMRRKKLPFFLRNTNFGVANAHFQVVRR